MKFFIANRTMMAIKSLPRLAAATSQIIPPLTSLPYQSHTSQTRTYYNGERTKKSIKNILVLGSHGILGKTIVNQFKGAHNVIGADVLSSDHPDAPESNYISLPQHGSIADLSLLLYRGVVHHLSDQNKLDAIIVAAGGWAGDVDSDNVKKGEDEDYIKEAAGVVEKMMRVNYYPVVAASLVGQRCMDANGLFVIIGASAALSPTPGMIGYGSSKAAAHHYLQTFGADNPISSVGFLPLMLDTPNNRAMMGDTDERYTKMVKPIYIANEIGEWIKNPELRPHSGSLVKVIAKERRDGSGGANFHLVR